MRKSYFPTVTILFVLALGLGSAASSENYKWDLPEGFQPPPVPVDNPMTPEKAELGRHLFYDRRMSVNGTQSCSSCHIQRLAFTDGKSRAVGSTGEIHSRGSMSLVNVAWAAALTWGNPNFHRLEEQARIPMFGTNPVELGMDPGGTAFLKIARSDKRYQALFQAAYPEDPNPFTIENVIRAIACFERTIISARSPWDKDWRQIKHLYSGFARDKREMSESAQRGEFLFFGERLECSRCHGGDNFNKTTSADERDVLFHNNGMPPGQPGLSEFSRMPTDAGKFKAPTMRNVELTAPYMHDGSIATLEGVIDHYAKGGSHNPNQSRHVRGFKLSKSERADLIEFLLTLTDKEVTKDPRFSDPWPEP
jgi:cytochrome c peroxidase